MTNIKEPATATIQKDNKTILSSLSKRVIQLVLDGYVSLLERASGAYIREVKEIMITITKNGGYNCQNSITPIQRQNVAKAQVRLLKINSELASIGEELNTVKLSKSKYCGI